VPSQKSLTLVAQSTATKGEGRFLAADEVPAQYSVESGRLAEIVASGLNVKVKRVPLFPLVGVNAPGIFVRMEGKEEELKGYADKLCSGIDKYFVKGTMNEK